MFLHPSQEETLVQEAAVQVPMPSHLLAGEETPQADAVVKVDKDDTVARRLDQAGAVPVGVGIPSVPAALDEDHDGELLVHGRVGGTPDVEEEAVLVDGVMECI